MLEPKIESIPLSKLSIDSCNIRKTEIDTDGTSIDDLAANIMENGLLHPITVRVSGYDKYTVIAGQRRFKAVCRLGFKTIQCNIIQVNSDQQAKEISLSENLQRNSMCVLDKIKAIGNLYELCNNDIHKLSQKISYSATTLRQYINASKLPKFAEQYFDRSQKSGRLSINIASILACEFLSDLRLEQIIKEILLLPNDTKRKTALNKIKNDIKEQNVSTIIKDINTDKVVETKTIYQRPWIPDKDGENWIPLIIPQNKIPQIRRLITK